VIVYPCELWCDVSPIVRVERGVAVALIERRANTRTGAIVIQIEVTS